MPPDARPRVHPTAQGFDTAARSYELARPEYPPQVLRSMADHLGLGPASVVVDLAAGTGKLTRSLRAALTIRIIAVEPSVGMRTEFVAAVPDVPVLDGTAEAIPLGDRTVDAVVVGHAFHWFRPQEALAEIARVLRPGGGLGLLWNQRDERVAWVARFGEILRRADHGEAPTVRSGEWEAAFRDGSGWEPLQVERSSTVHRLDPATLVERALSVSYVSKLPEAGRAELAAEVRCLLAEHPDLAGRSRVDLPYVTELYWTRPA